nr:MAG: ORF1 [TTV-like mini virus]UGV34456.1 MAG: ORF1 [TTV-like mini virus]
MAPYRRYYRTWKNYRPTYYNRYQRRKYRRFNRRRPQQTLRRRRRRRHRRLKVKKFKKLPYLRLKQYQPRNIRKCKITGPYCLLTCAHGRESNNYSQYQATRAPENYPAGGGFSILKFTLGALFEDLQKFRNFWTATNENLDLCRFTGWKFKFYRHEFVSYITTYSLCSPMVVHKLSHMQTHPTRLLLTKKKIVVPSLKDAPLKKKLYITKHIRPPKQLVNRWFFQKDFADTDLLLLHTSSIALNHMFQSTNSKNTTVGLICLNPKVFQNNNFANATGYSPNEQWNYWGELHSTGTRSSYTLLRGIKHEEGQSMNSFNEQGKYGNIFFHTYLHGEQNIRITAYAQQSIPTDTTPLNALPLIVHCRYQPYADKGTGNKIYLVSNLGNEKFKPPSEQHDFYIEGYPLWLMWWGWLDWCRKLRPGFQIETNYAAVIQSPYIWPQQDYYCPLDPTFYDNKGPWDTHIEDITLTQYSHWYPRVGNQEEAINSICLTGPAVPRAENITSWEAHAWYTAYFKWGGCHSPYTQIEDPSGQPKYPVPDKLILRPQIQDPQLQTAENLIYGWDYRRGQISDKAISRVSSDFFITDSLRKSRKRTTDPPLLKETKIQKLLKEAQESSEEEEKNQTIQQQLQQQRHRQHVLKYQLLKLIKKLSKTQQRNQRCLTPIT